MSAFQASAALLGTRRGTNIPTMPRTVMVIVGLIVLSLVSFGSPFEGNVLGFCPISEGPKAIGIDVIAALLDASAIWLIYRGVRA